MKKYLTLLIGGFIFLFMFAVPGGYVKAAENKLSSTTEIASKIATPMVQGVDCGCHVIPIVGSERNKMVAGLISSDEFKNVKMFAKQEGYNWLGANEIQTIKVIHPDGTDGSVLVGVPFSLDGITYMFVFIDGTFQGVTPLE